MLDQKTDLGLAVSLARSSFNSNVGSAKSNINAISAVVKKELDNKILFDTVATMLGNETYSQKHKGPQNSRLLFLSAKVGKQIELNNKLKFMPYAGGQFQNFDKPEATLKAENNQITSNPYNAQQNIMLIGAKLSGSTEYNSCYLQPFVDINVGYNFAASLHEESINSGGLDLKYSSDKNKNSSVSFSARFGMQATINDLFDTSLTAGVHYLENTMMLYTASIKLSYKL